MRVSQITAIGSFTDLALDISVLDYLALAPSRCKGLGGSSLRVTVEDAPGQDGTLIEPPLDGAWIITLAGDIVATSTGYSAETGYREAIDAVLSNLKSAVDAMKTSAGDLVFADSSSLSVWKYGVFDETWDDLETICSVTFSLIVDVFA